MSAQERVARGAAYLDETMPGWAERVDPGDLDMKDGCRCILGQLFRDHPRRQNAVGPEPAETGFTIALEELDLSRAPVNPDEWYGFDVPVEADTDYGFDGDTEYEELREAWQREIAARTGAPA